MKQQLEHLDAKVDELITLCRTLDAENKALLRREHTWLNERRQLLIKNDTARGKVDAMITRLKSMENSE